MLTDPRASHVECVLSTFSDEQVPTDSGSHRNFDEVCPQVVGPGGAAGGRVGGRCRVGAAEFHFDW